ncbi:uncharacterized protein LOC143915280 [Arctopsyche grandis]|uniref:uncharacterized protein LOC143915280 n=1 Tax=Arctopsyche grandis TaxID=121162 RepID=UPI00406D830E
MSRLIVIGGYSLQTAQTIEIYNADKQNWVKFGDLNTQKYAFSAVQVKGTIILLGGAYSSGPTNTVESYNLDSGIKKTLRPMTELRKYPHVAVMGDYVYVFGGHNSHSDNIETVERYDPKNDIWTKMPPLPTGRHGCGVVVLNDEIYLVGGWSNNEPLSMVDAFNPTTRTWRKCSSMSVKRMWPGVTAVGGHVYAIGGRKINSHITEKYASVERYDPIIDKWTFVASINLPRFGIAACPFNENILAIGGGDGELVSTVEEYDVVRDVWRVIGPLNVSREITNAIIMP